MRSSFRFPVRPWEFFLVREDPNRDHGLGSLENLGQRPLLVLHTHTDHHSHHRGLVYILLLLGHFLTNNNNNNNNNNNTSYNWNNWNSKENLKEKYGSYSRKTFDRYTTANSCQAVRLSQAVRRVTLWTLLVTFCIVITRCTEIFWSPSLKLMLQITIIFLSLQAE
jgi:hypothetical protein